jgi:hypothetical protein
VPDTLGFFSDENNSESEYAKLVDSLNNSNLKPVEKKLLMQEIKGFDKNDKDNSIDSKAIYEKKLEELKELRERYYELDSFESFDLYADGKSNFFPVLKAQEAMVLNDLLEKVGPNYVFNLGEVLYDQLDVESNHRNYPVSLTNSKLLRYQFVIEIPDGYELNGYNDIDREILNETGGLKVTHKLEGNQLIIDIEKSYIKKDVSVEEWPKMYEWLFEANKLNDLKLVFKPASS